MRIWFRGERRKWLIGLAALAAVGIISQMYVGVRAAEQRVLKPDPALVEEAKTQGVEVLRPIAVLPPLPMDVQRDNVSTPEKISLGAKLFFDTRLSGDASTACVKCHHPTMGWGESGDMSVGYPGNQHFRNSHSAMNTGYVNKLFWEGRTLALEAQAGDAGFGGSAGNVQRDMAQARLMQVPEYRKACREIFGTEPAWDSCISRAIASFQRHGLITNPKNVPFDRYMMGDDKALTEKQIQGMNLFAGKARCILCHNGPMFTDQDHYMTGISQPEAFLNDALRQIEVRFRCKANGITNYGECTDDLGLFFNTHRTADIMRFRTQTLRETKYTAPYMHNGAFFTFEEVVDYYNKGGGADQYGTKSKFIKPLNLSDQEKAALVTFLESLSSDELPGKEFSNPKLPGYSNAALD